LVYLRYADDAAFSKRLRRHEAGPHRQVVVYRQHPLKVVANQDYRAIRE